MGLTTYNQKRSFKKTPEPTGGKAEGDGLRFVVQKHDASHLHYDFRLEMRGVLKSWAVPKGPSIDPSVKRLAMMVEDHPYDYRNFEGIIPKGQYGGGTVIVWDEGMYEPAEAGFDSKLQMEKELIKQLHKGKITIRLHGQKLKGEYALVKSSYQGENSWLLMKVKDKFAGKSDITKKDKSVITGRTIPQVEKAADKVWHSSRENGVEQKKPAKKTAAKKTTASKKAVKKKPLGKKQRMPKGLIPMLATLVDKPFDAEGWLYEVKWDGYRALAYLNNGKVDLRSRNNKPFNEKYYPVHDALQKLNIDAVLDGEIIVAGDQGVSNFGDLQNWRSEADGELRFYVFDLLWYDGYSLMELPLTQRREILKDIVVESDLIHISQDFVSTGTEFFKVAGQMNLEGIMAKKEDSLYSPGVRTKEWLKIKISKRHEVVIGGYTQNEGSSKSFSSLLVGVFNEGKLHYTGKIGTGFSDSLQKEMMQKFKKLVTKKNPFVTEPDINKPSRFRPNPPKAKATWLKPQLVCEVSYAEMTSDGVMRHPSFEGLREDKDARQVKAEVAKPVEAVVSKPGLLHKKKIIKTTDKKGLKTLVNPSEKQQVKKINGRELVFTNLQKVYWPKEKILKRDVINYYYQVAPYILPYLKDRPQSLNRYPNGINGESFYQKNIAGKFPGWIETHDYKNTTKEGEKKFFVCTDEAHLLYMANLGCIEMNPWNSRVAKPDKPDWCVIDLDPDDSNTFEQVIKAANTIHGILASVDVPCYPKTSGSTGIHIYIPLGAKYDYEQSKMLAQVIVTLANRDLPDFTSLERTPSKRKGKIYLDFLQNRSIQTIAAPYSLRPRPGATVSMPLEWNEVNPGLKISDFSIFNAAAEVPQRDKLFKPVLGKGINLKTVIKKIEQL